ARRRRPPRPAPAARSATPATCLRPDRPLEALSTCRQPISPRGAPSSPDVFGMLRPVDLATFAVVVVCLGAGGALGWLAARARSAAEIARLDATLRATREGEGRLEQPLRALS